MRHLKLFEELIKNNAEMQLSDFNSNEDKVKSAFMKDIIRKNWRKRLESRYPMLSFSFYNNGDTLKAQATIKKVLESYKSMSVDEHIENIEDILLDFTEDRLCEVVVLGEVNNGSNKKLSRTFKVKISITDDIIWNILTPEEKAKHQIHRDRASIRIFGHFENFPLTHYVPWQVVKRLSEMRSMCIKRLTTFGYRLYRENHISDRDVYSTFYVTYRPNKFKS
jgi:hypothetical protein